MLSHADLPNDIDALKALLLASEQVVRERDEVVSSLREQLATSSVEIEHLKLMIAKLRRMQFGRKSEKLDHQIEQLELQLEDLQATEGEAEREMPPAHRAPRAKSARKPLPEHLPRDEQVHAPAACAPQVRRPARGQAIAADHRGTAANRRTVCDRGPDPRQTAQ